MSIVCGTFPLQTGIPPALRTSFTTAASSSHGLWHQLEQAGKESNLKAISTDVPGESDRGILASDFELVFEADRDTVKRPTQLPSGLIFFI